MIDTFICVLNTLYMQSMRVCMECIRFTLKSTRVIRNACVFSAQPTAAVFVPSTEDVLKYLVSELLQCLFPSRRCVFDNL